MTFWWFLFGFLFICQAQVRTNNNDWAHWADWKQWMSSNNAGTDESQKTPYWNNYGNWKQWVQHAQGGGGNSSPYGSAGGGGGAPWSSTPYGSGGNPSPSKVNFDSWRKWNLQQEAENGDDWKNYGRWQTWAEKNGEGDYAAYVSFQEWTNRDKVQPQEAFNLDSLVVAAANSHSDKGDDGSKRGHQAKPSEELNLRHRSSEDKEADRKAVDDKNAKESFEQWIKRNKYVTDKETTSKDKGRHSNGQKNSATHHEELREESYEHHSASANEDLSDRTHESDSAKKGDAMDWQSYAQGWRKYVPGSGGNAQSSTSDYSTEATGDGWQSYGTSNDGQSSPGGDWSKYVPEAYRAEIGPSAMGTSQSTSARGITPQTLVSTDKNDLPEPGYGLKHTESSQIDWHKYVPESYSHFIPDEKAIQEQNDRHSTAKRGEQSEGSEYPWRDAIPAPYRENVPSKETLERLKKEETRAPSPAMINAAALYQSEQSTSYGMGWVAVGLCLIIVSTTVAYVYKRYSKRLEYDNLKDTRIARSEATDVDHLLLI